MTEQQKTYMAMQNPGVREEWERLCDAAPAMLELLREMEWAVPLGDEDASCRICARLRGDHAPGCKLAALLARFPR